MKNKIVLFAFLLIMVTRCNFDSYDYKSQLNTFQNEVNLFDTTFRNASIIYMNEPISYTSSTIKYQTKLFFKKNNIIYDDFIWEEANMVDSFEAVFPDFGEKSKIIDSTYLIDRRKLSSIEGVNISNFPRQTDTVNAAFVSVSVPVFSKDYNYCYFIKSVDSPEIFANCQILYRKEKNKWLLVASECM